MSGRRRVVERARGRDHALPTPAPRPDAPVIWHDVECAGYHVDLPVWRSLAEDASGAVLDIGCGTGRVGLDLSMRGYDVTGLDSEPALVRAMNARARTRRLPARAHVADARSFELGRRFGLAIAPMQVAQLLGGADGRRAMLTSARRHLMRGGTVAVALADPFEGLPAEQALPPLPDVEEREGWVFQSTPVTLRAESGATAIDRLHQIVSPAGELTEEVVTVRLDRVDPEELEAAGPELGLRPLERLSVPATDDYVGSAVVVLEAV